MENNLKIKICGLYREADIEAVNQFLPDYAGFVFYPPSHRNVTEEQAKNLKKELDGRIQSVGVFVDAVPKEIAKLVREGVIDIVQLHGHEKAADIERLRALLGADTEIWKAYKIRSIEDLKEAQNSSADRVLYDNGYGTGECFDWSLLTEEQNMAQKPFILAGGITPQNIFGAVRRFRPEIIDVSSGVETDKRKDREKIQALIQAVRSLQME